MVLAWMLLCASVPGDDPDNQHWSFRPIRQPVPPKVRNNSWPKNAIDRFILARLEAEGLHPAQAATQQQLSRRIHFDLTGLPPAPRLTAGAGTPVRFGAYEQLVDQLLASPRYGEKWGQHWLDLARFAETDGFEHDKIRNTAWRYRDWVIRALNEGMPYDEFVTRQVAGDELKPNDPEQQFATAFCLSGPDMPDINSQEERRQNVLNELTGTVGATLMGLQMGCAQCHDHKYDPLSQEDFYRLRSIFEPAINVIKDRSLDILKEKGATFGKSYLMIRGDWQRKGKTVEPGLPAILVRGSPWENSAEFRRPTDQNSTGRRLAFARWMTDRSNPLTARVIANRVWQYHFGSGLVATPNDFGLIGEVPSHPLLLDWLAAELMNHDWSLKHLHRLILCSATYRQKSETGNKAPDQGNQLLFRFPRQRLSGETIRDAMLASSGTLHHRMGGRGVMPPIPAELASTLLKNQWKASNELADHYRRSIFIFARRNLRYPLFDAFDRPDGNSSCPQRNQSTTAPQSLHLLNSVFSLDAARRLAGAVLRESDSLDDAIHGAYQRTLSRDPRPEEFKLVREFLTDQADLIQREFTRETDRPAPIPDCPEFDSSTAAAFSLFCLALFNSNEFLYID